MVLLWPERVVVGGGVAAAGELLLGPIRDEMRRRACVAPVDAMRFDDSFYRLFGSALEQLGAAPALLASDDTYGERATGGAQLPGLLARSFELTL